MRAAGAIPRLVHLLDTDFSNPIVEVVVRTLHKLAEKSEDIQSDIRRNKGIAKLVEMQSKGDLISAKCSEYSKSMHNINWCPQVLGNPCLIG